MTKTIDTNVLLRLLIDDPSNMKQCKLARNWASKEKEVFVPQIVQIELVWAMKKAYQFSKEKIANVLNHLVLNSAFKLQNREIFMLATKCYSQCNVSFSDSIILVTAETESFLPLVTFNKELAKLKHARLV